MLAQLVRGGRCTWCEHHHGGQVLAQHLVRDADHGRLQHTGVLAEHRFYVRCMDVVSSPDYHVLLSAHDVQVPVAIQTGEITGAEPAVVPGAGRRLRVAVVLAMASGQAQKSLTDLARG
jgi:hypothetical protein